MPRVTSRFARNRAEDEMRRFLRGRTLAYLPNNAALGTDYALRWLNHFPKDVEALSLGQLLGDATQQPELSDKCFESLGEIVSAKARKERRFLETLNDAATGGMLSEEQQGEMLSTMLSPEVAEAMVTLQTLMGEAAAAGEEGSHGSNGIDGANPFNSSSETLKVSPSSREVPLSAIQSYLDAAGRGRVVDLSREAEEDQREGGGGSAASANIIQHHRRVEILSPTDAPYGRGLFATAPLRHGDVLFAEVPALHVTMPPCPSSSANPKQRPTHCNYCAKPLMGFGSGNQSASTATTTECRSGCSDVSYCSPACEANSYATCHGPICGKTNPLFAQWAAPMLRDYYGDGSSSSSPSASSPSPKDQKAALTMYAVGIACATATAAQIHPLKYKPFAMLSGQVSYDRVSALAYTGAIAVGLASALRQQHLYLDDVMSLFALLMDNGFYNESRGGGGGGGSSAASASSSSGPSTLSLYPLMAMVNHSCVPNCVIVDAPASVQAAVANSGGRASSSPSSSSSTLVKQLTVLKDMLPGEQLFINYNHKLMGSGRNALGYEARKALLSQRHFTCTCPKCVLRQ